ncbi:MAG: hypothetical protein R3240_11345 [Gammaproteobacteria bacterium]|nr:hypothetical protein [Gammaproteobacteria bacterium]
MKKLLLLLALFLPFLWSCGNGSTSMNNQDPMNGGSDIIDTPQDTTNQDPGSTEVPVLPDAPEPPDPNLSNALSISTASAAASGFCDSQKQLQVLSTSLMSAYSPKGNGPDIYYCGGTANFTEDGMLFDIELTDYCVNARGHQVMLNGMIHGETDSGANFFSDIPQLTIEGDGINLSLDGTTRYGRADDMFMDLNISDLVNNIEIGLEDVNIKHNSKTKNGEFDLGYLNLPNVGKFYFKFITHFNPELTEGMLFIYGEADQVIIISADNGNLTVVYKVDRHDPGTLLTQTSCGS